MKNYYATLGVTQEAPSIVINAAYKALCKKYHPDLWTGKKAVAETKIRELNEAHENLSDPKKRKVYDTAFSQSAEYEDTSAFQSKRKSSRHDFKTTDWDVVEEYYPEIEVVRKNLQKIDETLAISFQLVILSEKDYDHFSEFETILKKAYFERYFGTDKKLNKFVESILIAGHRDIAKELNRDVRVLGASKADEIISNIKTKHQKALYGRDFVEVADWADEFEDFFFNQLEFPDNPEFFIEYVPDTLKCLVKVKITYIENAGTIINSNQTELDFIEFTIDLWEAKITTDPNNSFGLKKTFEYKTEIGAHDYIKSNINKALRELYQFRGG